MLVILAGSAIAAALIRRLAGAAAIERHKEATDGFNILAVFVFVAAVMGGVAPAFITAPAAMIGLIALAFATSAAVLGVTMMLFAAAGRERAFALAMMTSQRNMGLMLAATGGVLPETAWLYFAAGLTQSGSL